MQKRWREGAFLTKKNGEMLLWASTTHRHILQLPFPISDLRCRQSWLMQTRAGSHLAPRSGFPKQTATGNSNEIQKGNCSYHCPTHTHVPSSPPHPFLLGSEAEGPCCRAAPAQTHPHSQQARGWMRHSGAARPQLGRWQDIPRVRMCRRSCSRSHLPCQASECFGSVVADEDVQEWVGWVVRRGEGRRKSAVLCLRCLGSSCGLLKMSQAGWGAGCRT